VSSACAAELRAALRAARDELRETKKGTTRHDQLKDRVGATAHVLQAVGMS
jgi:hypothetical protein